MKEFIQILKYLFRKIPAFLKNKYVLTSILFLIWMLFFDSNTFISQVKRQMQTKDMEVKKMYYLQEIKQVNQALDELLTNDKTLEKFAREKYLMKRENEDIFVIEEKD